MAIPVYLQQFKAAGIYRIVFDKSTVAGVDSEILRMVVGYSEKGPFNIPTYVTSPSDFKAIYGDISKKLEKRGVFFHRMAIQALAGGPILCLNLKKFDGETVDGASINTDFNPSFEIIDTVKLNVEDIYDTSRFWELSAEKLNGLKSASGAFMDQYINICTTNTKESSATYFIRKASGSKVNGYNITVSDWYSDGVEELPEFLQNYTNSLISDFMAEVYVFKGRFTASQVLASSTLKNYFEMSDKKDENGNPILKLRQYVTNAYGEPVDTLDELYKDETSGALVHYIGSLIPFFKNKNGQYMALDIMFNSDIDTHNMMMSFNVDMLEDEGTAHIDLSGRLSISTDDNDSAKLNLHNLFAGEAKTSLLGNSNAPVVSEVLAFDNSVVKVGEDGKYVAIIPFSNTDKKVVGTLYVNAVVNNQNEHSITLKQVGTTDNVKIECENEEQLAAVVAKMDLEFVDGDYNNPKSGYGTAWTGTNAFINDEGEFIMEGPQKVITAITRLERVQQTDNYHDEDMNMKVSVVDVAFTTKSNVSENFGWNIYGSSVSFIPFDTDVWGEGTTFEGAVALVNSNSISDSSIFSIISVGDCFLAEDGTTDRDHDADIDETDGFYDNVYVQEVKSVNNESGDTVFVIKFSGNPLIYSDTEGNSYLVRVDSALNQEVGTMIPQYLEGYVYKNSKPKSSSMIDKLNWQEFILSALTEYKGLRIGLLNKSDVDYRYIVDTFETFVDGSVKKVLSYLAKEKQSAFAILNFPAVKTFVKCPYTSFTDSKGVFQVDYVAKGYNKKKAFTKQFSLPTDSEGASFCAFYTPLKFSDGYVDTIIPSAALVSNLFMTKYTSRQPYYIIAGPNYAKIQAAGLVGPDYNYSMDELQVLEPFGVNAMVYRPGFGTFVNANQTAKQTPVSALSKVNVRELVIYLQDEIEKVLQAYQWEFNNPTTRNAILDKANMICARVQANGGIQAYLNVMDESNNTPEIIDNEMAILSTHIEPGMGCGKMIHELTLYRTGQMSSNIIE